MHGTQPIGLEFTVILVNVIMLGSKVPISIKPESAVDSRQYSQQP